MLNAIRITHSNITGLGAALVMLAAPGLARTTSAPGSGGFLPETVMGFITGVEPVTWIAAGLTASAATLLISRRQYLLRRQRRHEILALRPGPRFAVIDAMVHCLGKAARLDDARVLRAREIAASATDMSYTPENLLGAAQVAEDRLVPDAARHLGDGLNHDEKIVVFNAALAVLLADGPLTPEDRDILKAITSALGLQRAELRELGKLIPA